MRWYVHIGAISAVIVSMLVSPLGRTQPAPDVVDGRSPDPPARVGRVADTSGTVSFRAASQDHWEKASLNYPVTSGDALWTEPEATAEVEIESNRVVLDERTELDIDAIGDHAIALTEPLGVVELRLPDLALGDTVLVRTPRGTVKIDQPGRYEIVAGDRDDPTLVTVAVGMARIEGDNLAMVVSANQTAALVGTDSFTGSLTTAPGDLAAESPPTWQVPETSRMTGAQALTNTGEWGTTPEYGDVWYPPVDSSWVPYRDGYWAYTAPWGWTWIDAAPWGFAISHYGRWVLLGSRWCWAPERGRRFGVAGSPVFAPALVRWFDVPGRAAGLEGAVGWIPLGPRERFTPWYRSSEEHTRGVNHVDILMPGRFGDFLNSGGASVALTASVVTSRPFAATDPGVAFAGGRPVLAPDLRPTWATAGVTPAVARQFHLDPAASGIFARPTGPGPAFQAARTSPGVGQPESADGGVRAPTANVGRGVDSSAIIGGAVLGGAAAGGAILLDHQGFSHGSLPPLAAHQGPTAVWSQGRPEAGFGIRPGGEPTGPTGMPRTQAPGFRPMPTTRLDAPAQPMREPPAQLHPWATQAPPQLRFQPAPPPRFPPVRVQAPPPPPEPRRLPRFQRGN